MLVAEAEAARQNAHAPYSCFAVGAALLASSGRVYTGCNVENASYGLTVCAERVALFSAISAGERRFEAVTVITDTPAPTWPCGACLQVLAEFGGELTVIAATVQGSCSVASLRELLPHPFTTGPSGGLVPDPEGSVERP